MNRIAMYILVFLQIVFISVLVYHFENINKFGKEITILTKIDYTYFSGYSHLTDLYVTYDINEIPKQLWEKDEELDYNRPVYVVLTKNEHEIDEVNRVTLQKPKDVSPEKTVIKANYDYRDNRGYHHVRYGFEWLENANQFGDFREGDRLQVTVLLGKWGQQKVVNIVKMDE